MDVLLFVPGSKYLLILFVNEGFNFQMFTTGIRQHLLSVILLYYYLSSYLPQKINYCLC